MNYHKTKLLSWNNHKTIKGEKITKDGLPYKTYIMYLSPFTHNSKGINLCPHASKGCSESCLVNSGFGGMYQSVMEGRKNKSEWFLEDRKGFMLQLYNEISKAIARHSDKIVTFRLNGTSDIRFEKIKIVNKKNIFELFPNIQFYDYTKNAKRVLENKIPNYHLTFSRSETNHKEFIKVLESGFNVAMVFNKVPENYLGYKVIIGDDTDLRFLGEKNVIVGLTYKSNTGKGSETANKAAFTSNFAIKL